MPQTARRKNPWLDDIPSVDEIIDQAMRRLNLSPNKIRNLSPYEVVSMLERECHAIYNEYERIVREYAKQGKYGVIDPQVFETSLANSRRARAGSTLEKLFVRMLDLYKVPYERNIHIQKEVEFDFVFPNLLAAISDPKHSVLLSVKREVRERWKLTVGDAYILRHKYGYPLLDNIWFISLGEPPLEAVTAMTSLCIRIYVPDDIFLDIRSKAQVSISKNEMKRIKKFSEVISDIMRIVVNKEIEVEECEIRQYELNLAKMRNLLDFIKNL